MANKNSIFYGTDMSKAKVVKWPDLSGDGNMAKKDYKMDTHEKDDLTEEVIDALKSRLTINVTKRGDYDCDSTYLYIELLIDNKVIASDSTSIKD